VLDYQRFMLSRLVVHDCAVADRALKPCRSVEVRETMTKKRWLFFLYAKHGFDFYYDIMRVIAHVFDLFFAHDFL
jgi:hypothetical protein